MPIVLLDSTPLGLLSDPKNNRDPVQCKSWANRLVRNDIIVVIPGIIDYELRRQLILSDKAESIQELDQIRSVFPHLPLTEEMLEKAAELWAWARRTGQQTAHNENIDMDVILAAQAIVLAGESGEYVVVATSNPRHIQRYTPAEYWRDITVENCLNPKPNIAPALSQVE